MFSKNDNIADVEAIPVTASVYAHNNTYTNTTTSVYDTKKQPKRCRDPVFAFLFYANIAAIVGVAIKFGSNPFTTSTSNPADDDADIYQQTYTALIYTALGCGGFSIVLSLLLSQVMMCIPTIMIKVALFFNLALTGAAAVFGFIYGSWIYGLIMGIFFLLMLCYIKLVWARIPFASANLETACQAIRSNCGITIVAYGMVALAFGWTILWSVALAGVWDDVVTCETLNAGTANESVSCSKINYGYLFLLFLSYFFTHQVIQNSIHVTVAGVVGTWWFVPEEAKSCCSSAIWSSLVRTLTTSFGSICFGSLLVAIIQALRQIANTARNNDDANPILICIVDCILACIEGILEYFNKWAFIYVGLYGYSYLEAGKGVMTLFRDRGWEAVIADDLVSMVLGMLSLVVGLLTGAFALIFESRTDWFDTWESGNASVVAFVIGLIVGLVLCSILMSTIASAVNAAIVLFAEGPAEFERHYPDLSKKMRDAYLQAHPGCL